MNANTPATYDVSYAFEARPELRYDWNDNSDMLQSGANFSDIEVAGKVRMLMRGDLNHESVCVMARDRIMALSKEVARLRSALSEGQQK